MDHMAEEMKMIQPLNLRQKSLNQIFMITQILMSTGDIAAVGGNANTNVAFKNCTPFTRFVTHIHI